jgi:hypothetical protein
MALVASLAVLVPIIIITKGYYQSKNTTIIIILILIVGFALFVIFTSGSIY